VDLCNKRILVLVRLYHLAPVVEMPQGQLSPTPTLLCLLAALVVIMVLCNKVNSLYSM
jgi:hypothetical protein